nr:barnase [Bacillus intermedius]
MSAQVINTFDGVADYLQTYHKLPDNYITKSEAQALGWV